MPAGVPVGTLAIGKAEQDAERSRRQQQHGHGLLLEDAGHLYSTEEPDVDEEIARFFLAGR